MKSASGHRLQKVIHCIWLAGLCSARTKGTPRYCSLPLEKCELSRLTCLLLRVGSVGREALWLIEFGWNVGAMHCLYAQPIFHQSRVLFLPDAEGQAVLSSENSCVGFVFQHASYWLELWHSDHLPALSLNSTEGQVDNVNWWNHSV